MSIAFLFLSSFSFPQNPETLNLSVEDFTDYTRLTIESSSPLNPQYEKRSSFLMIKIRPSVSYRVQRPSFRSRVIQAIGGAKGKDYYLLNIRMKNSQFYFDHFTLKNPPRIVIDISFQDRKKEKEDEVPERRQVREFKRSSQAASIRSPREKRIVVIDPGHGGLESGAKGKFGTEEKNITLAISLKLKAIIERNLAFRVVLTRDKDIDVSLDSRAAIANNNRADVFISVHTNSSYRKEAKGAETFFLSRDATDEEARRLAYLENNSAEFDEGIMKDNEDEIQMILWDLAQTAYLKQSSQMAEFIQKELNLIQGTANRGIKQAPFKVLTGVACPAVLVEVAFISNPDEEGKLGTEGFQSSVAQAIYRGLANYLKTSSQK